MSIADRRAVFHETVAPGLAAQLGDWSPAEPDDGPRLSQRFAYFERADEWLAVVGDQEGGHADLALPHALARPGSPRLHLVLHETVAFPTLQRCSWLRSDRRPLVWVYGDDHRVERTPAQTAEQTVHRLIERLNGRSPSEDLHRDTAAHHLGERSRWVQRLVGSATEDPRLDPAHRRDLRAWHCQGQRILSIRRTTKGIRIRAGIHWNDGGINQPFDINRPHDVTATLLERIHQQIEEGIAQRMHGEFHKADEHWFQAVLAQRPSLLGVEPPVLRELPAWRPSTGSGSADWRRGYLDLIGLDGDGNIRVIETKLATNADDLLVLQGLDYYVWALAYRDAIGTRLGASPKAGVVIDYVLGSDGGSLLKMSPRIWAQVDALDPSVHWRFQTVTDWFDGELKLEHFQPGEVPTL